jgi:hypothetical protein
MDSMPVAVKVLPVVLARNRWAIDALKREAAIALRLTHPHICRLHTLHADGATKFLVMEYLPGKTLDEFLDTRPGRKLTWAELEPIARQLAEALDYAHAVTYADPAGRQVKGILHRDIKPQNIMVSPDPSAGSGQVPSARSGQVGTANLMDFGIAREIHSTMTDVTGRPSMTPLYASPEQFRGQRMAPAADVYSLAAVLYECLAGRRLVAPDGDIAYQVLEKPFEPLADQPPEINAMLAAGLAKDPAARPATASALLALASPLAPPPVPPLGESPTSRAAPPDRPLAASQHFAKGKHMGIWLGAVALLALAGLAVWAIASGKWSNAPSGSERPLGVREPATRQAGAATGLGLKKELSLDLGGGMTVKVALIPAGKFIMGSPETEAGRESSEGPQRVVTITKPFYMGVYEVTQGQYKAVIRRDPRSEGKDPNIPVGAVTWDDAVEFCRRLTQKTNKLVRLPTEAEWEYACRAGSKTAYCFGNDGSKLGDYAWLMANSGGEARPVGQKKPNPWGLYDMHGNVGEWCSDWFADSYAEARTVDPQGPDSGTKRVARNQGFDAQWCRSAKRCGVSPNYASEGGGFRVAVSVPGGD